MSRKHMSIIAGVAAIVALGAASVGAFPRYIEELRIGGGYHAEDGGADFDRHGNIAGSGDLHMDGDMSMGGDLDVGGTFGMEGGLTLEGPLTVTGGEIAAGTAGVERGILSAREGGGTQPGAVEVRSADGSPWYLFVTDDGIVRVHDAPPGSNTDGAVIGTQF